jgi:putative hemolysin
MSRYGKRGFYTYTLFRMDRPMDRVLRRSFELGRSFIAVEYQRQRLPLYMLWRGLLLHITANPDHQYLIGPVSISGTYSRFSRTLIMEFVQQHHYDQEMAASGAPAQPVPIKPDKSR